MNREEFEQAQQRLLAAIDQLRSMMMPSYVSPRTSTLKIIELAEGEPWPPLSMHQGYSYVVPPESENSRMGIYLTDGHYVITRMSMNDYSEYELAVHGVLRDWFNALEDGSYIYRVPDPNYVRPEGKEEWTEEKLENLCVIIDEYVLEQKHWAEGAHKREFDADPGYARLEGAQRVAFAIDLEKALVENYPKAMGFKEAP